MQKCTKRLSEHKGYGACWIALVKDDVLEVDGCTEELTDFLHIGMKIRLNTEGLSAFAPSIEAFNTGSAVMLQALNTQDSLEAWSFIAKENGYGSFIALPLINRRDEKPFGVLSVYAQSADGFRPKEAKMLQELSGDIGFAIHSYIQREEFHRNLSIDAISGLPNRVSLIDYLSLHPVSALAILNIDRFSDINDVYGVAIGDQVLAGYGHWLSKKVEKTTGAYLYKLGSDEYVLVFDEHHDYDDSVAFLEYLIDKTEEESFVIEGIEVILSITVGADFKSEKLIENATRALKQAKLQHKSLSIYTPLIGAKKEQANNIQWYKEIKEALEEDRIVPYFQPIVDNKSHKIIKYEALVRLIKRDGTVISPYFFLDIAKKIRLYPSLTKVMFDKVIGSFGESNIPVSINLSTEDLMNVELGNYIEEQLERYKVGKKIIFEILESEGIENYTQVSSFIERFRNLGCSFAIDDFGSGFSNFDHLLRLNIDTLKIDGSLIKNLTHDRNAQIIVRHICDFAHEMGFNTIAEFVADEAIYRKVLEIGIDASQGYYFYEPTANLIVNK
jgi:diguanylate cyclase (GGDEF)-like protein